MAEQDLQKRSDELALRFQSWNRWIKIADRVAETNREKASEIYASIKKYIEPQKILEDIVGLSRSVSLESGRALSSRDLQKLLMKHVPGQTPAEGIGIVFMTLAGIALIVYFAGLGWKEVEYGRGRADAERILAKEHPEYALPPKPPLIGIPGLGIGIGLLALVLGAVFLLPKLLPKKGAA
ncbi:hypothetical protein ES702_07411 [subsurface metagenome]